MKEKIKTWLKENWFELIFLLLIVVFVLKLPQQDAIPFLKEIILLIIGYAFAILLQRKKNRPKIVPHGCRILGQDVYTYFDPDNNSSEPACSYLSDQKEGDVSLNPLIKIPNKIPSGMIKEM